MGIVVEITRGHAICRHLDPRAARAPALVRLTLKKTQSGPNGYEISAICERFV
jgi:hypothetical protein